MSVAASSLSFIDGSILNVALPAIRASTGAGAAEVQWVVNARAAARRADPARRRARDHRAACGGDRDRAVRCRVPVCALSGSLEMLLAGRVLQGIGAALLLPNSLALLNGAFEGEARGQAIGTWAAAGAIAAAIAPLIGGWLVENVGWPSIFYINLPLVAAAILVAQTRVEEVKEPEKARLDIVGARACDAGPRRRDLWPHALVAEIRPNPVATSESLPVQPCWLRSSCWERRCGNKAMVPLTLFGNRCFTSLNLMTFLLYGAFGGALLLIPYVLIEAGGYSPIQAGLSLLPLSILLGLRIAADGQAGGSPGPENPADAGPDCGRFGLLLGTRIAEDQAMDHAFPAILVMSIGMTLAVAPLTSTVLAAVEKHQTGMASGLNSGRAPRRADRGCAGRRSAGGRRRRHAQALCRGPGGNGHVAALGGAASFFGLQGKWRRHEPEPGQVS